MMALAGVELETLVFKPDALITRPLETLVFKPDALTTRPPPCEVYASYIIFLIFYAYEHLNTRQFYNT